VPDLGARVKTALATYRGAGGRDACILFHAAGTGEEAIARLARQGEGLPARVIPLAVHHVASVGMDVWLGTLAYGASNVVVLYGGDEAPWYRDATATQMAIAEDIVQALGYQDTHLVLAEANGPGGLAQALAALSPALAVRVPAAFNWTSDKRTTLSMAIDHLLEHAPVPQQVIALKEGAPFGTLRVNADTCTLCLACVGACPEGALADGAEMPQLRFIETRCVQCGLCENTCPEHAITLEPRLLLGPEARQARVLHEAAVFHCISCNTPLGTQKMMDAMLSKIGGHSMWQAPGALDRLKMCADCRVKDMMKKELI
jgi:ferredoxin